MPLYPYYNYIYKNNGDLTFSNMAKEWGFNTRSYSNGSAYADLDNDGDLDLIVNNINEPAYIYRNNASNQHDNHFLSVALKGNGMNTRGIGARVTIYCDGSAADCRAIFYQRFYVCIFRCFTFWAGISTGG